MVMNYYVYVLSRPNGTPFYVGKGVRARIDFHEWSASRGERTHKANLIRKIWACGEIVAKTKVAVGLSHEQATQLERDLIVGYGRTSNGGVLVNLTDGGDGAPSFKHTPVSLMKMRAAWKSRAPTSDETRKKMSTASTGRKLSDSAKAKLAAICGQRHWNYGRTLSESHKQKLNAVRFSRPVTVNGNRFESIAAAARAYQLAPGSALYRITRGKNRGGKMGIWTWA